MQRINPTPVFKERDKICKGSVCPLLAEASCCFSLNTARRVSSFYDPTLPAEINNKKKHLGREQKDAIQQRERGKKKRRSSALRRRVAAGSRELTEEAAGAVSRRVRASSLPMKEVEIGVALAKKSPGSFIF